VKTENTLHGFLFCSDAHGFVCCTSVSLKPITCLQKFIGIPIIQRSIHCECVRGFLFCLHVEFKINMDLSAHTFRCMGLWFDLLTRVFRVQSITCLQTF